MFVTIQILWKFLLPLERSLTFLDERSAKFWRQTENFVILSFQSRINSYILTGWVVRMLIKPSELCSTLFKKNFFFRSSSFFFFFLLIIRYIRNSSHPFFLQNISWTVNEIAEARSFLFDFPGFPINSFESFSKCYSFTN